MIVPLVGDLVKFAYTSTAVGGFKLSRYCIHIRPEGVLLLIDAHEIFIQFHCSLNGHVLKVWLHDADYNNVVLLKRHQLGKKMVWRRKAFFCCVGRRGLL